MTSLLDPKLFLLLANDGGIAFAIIGSMLAIVGVFAFAVWQYEKKRSAQLEEVAADLGLPFFPKGDPALIDRLNRMHLFSQGRSKKITNMLHGETNDVEVGIFDYKFTTGGGKNSQTHKQTVIYFRSPQLNLPQFDIRPEGFFHKIGSVFGYQDIDFASHPEFSRKYLLRGESEPAIREFFDEDLLSFFETHKKICVEALGDEMVFYRQRKRVKPLELQGLLKDGFEVFSALKGAVEANADPLE